MEVPWWEWMLFRLAVYLVTAPAVVAAMYLIFRKRGPWMIGPGHSRIPPVLWWRMMFGG